ncbi:MAG: dephospho-CoA kinase [Leptospiraceae bacterium]|nr:dephospho-CoA kinase [Leptospiraceae bacterium]MDW8305827.1 dephospho-CoA kinase [Leptospiraceae bacterium]
MSNPYGRVWGITGILGSGKSTVAKILARLGAKVLDADSLAREVAQPQSPFYREIRQSLETEFFQEKEALFFPDGQLNRGLLAAIAFASAEKTQKLNQIFHPAVEKLFEQKLSQLPPQELIVYDVPLLFEAGLHKKLKGTIVVSCDQEKALERAQKRTGLSRQDLLKRLAHQIPLKEKCQMADYVIDNNGNLCQLYRQVKSLYPKLSTGTNYA